MKTLGKTNDKKVSEWWEKICTEAAKQDESPFVTLARESEGMKQIIIRWMKEDIAELEKVKSLHE
jgi:hypothetical protein